MTTPIPTQIRRLKSAGIHITWSNGETHELTSRTLRMNCPCAACRESRGDKSHASPLTPKKSSLKIVQASSQEELNLEEIWGIGNYALGLRWADGHDTGIYTFDTLYQLGLNATKGAPFQI